MVLSELTDLTLMIGILKSVTGGRWRPLTRRRYRGNIIAVLHGKDRCKSASGWQEFLWRAGASKKHIPTAPQNRQRCGSRHANPQCKGTQSGKSRRHHRQQENPGMDQISLIAYTAKSDRIMAGQNPESQEFKAIHELGGECPGVVYERFEFMGIGRRIIFLKSLA